MRSSRSAAWCVGVSVVLGALALAASAGEVVVQNDSISGGVAVVVGDFVPGEQAGARLTSTCNGTIVAVLILWLAGTPGHGESLEEAIHIYNGSTFPTPGAELAFLEGPVMTPGYWNEFRYLDEAGTIPLNVAVTNGQQFYVSLEFANPTDVGGGGPSVVRDTNGCQAGKNVIDAGPGTWYSACLLGVQGDWGIRAVILCPDPTGACCYTNGSCAVHTQTECTGGGGTYQGNGTTCSPNPCPAPSGACCSTDGSCTVTLLANCSGTWQGGGTTCTPNPCPQPTGACCHADGTCVSGVTQAACTTQYGNVWYNGQPCAQITCTARGACCRAGSCLTLVTPANCQAIGGVYAGNGTNCADSVCVAGACCKADGTCLQNFGFQCAALGGTYHGPGTSCSPNPCPQPLGACCFGTFCLSDQYNAECTSAGGVWVGALTTCEPTNPCAPQGCKGDMNCDGRVTFADIDLFVAALSGESAWTHTCPWINADCNSSGTVNFADIDPFVALIGTTCH